MQELDPTWGRVISVWWLLAWRSAVGAVLLGVALGSGFSAVAALANWPADRVQAGGFALGAMGGVLWALIVVRMALKKRYSNFRIGLVPVTTA